MKNTLIIALLGAAALACGDDTEDKAETGEVEVTVYGEEFIEEGVPAELVNDGWAVTFERFTVAVRDVRVGGAALTDPAAPVNLAVPSEGRGHPLGYVTLPAGRHSAPSFVLDDVQVVGRATKGDITKTFDWTFDRAVAYRDCETTTDVSADGAATFQITVHADHFLYDSLASEEPGLVFQHLADADTDGDGAITQEELAAAPIGLLDAGDEDDITNLWGWLTTLSTSLGHVDGEGHCSAQPQG